MSKPAGYRGLHKRDEAQGPRWHVAMQPGKRRQLDLTRPWAQLIEQAEQLKASIRLELLIVSQGALHLRTLQVAGVALHFGIRPVNMLTLWDNRCTLHNAEGDYEGYQCIMQRTILAGERPVGVLPPN